MNERQVSLTILVTSPDPWRYKLSFHSASLTHVFYFRFFFPSKYVFLASDTQGLGSKFSHGGTFCHLFQRQKSTFLLHLILAFTAINLSVFIIIIVADTDNQPSMGRGFWSFHKAGEEISG